jgi:hypothetical protein
MKSYERANMIHIIRYGQFPTLPYQQTNDQGCLERGIFEDICEMASTVDHFPEIQGDYRERSAKIATIFDMLFPLEDTQSKYFISYEIVKTNHESKGHLLVETDDLYIPNVLLKICDDENCDPFDVRLISVNKY